MTAFRQAQRPAEQYANRQCHSNPHRHSHQRFMLGEKQGRNAGLFGGLAQGIGTPNGRLPEGFGVAGEGMAVAQFFLQVPCLPQPHQGRRPRTETNVVARAVLQSGELDIFLGLNFSAGVDTLIYLSPLWGFVALLLSPVGTMEFRQGWNAMEPLPSKRNKKTEILSVSKN